MTTIKLSSETGIPSEILSKMLESLLKEGHLITFHWNDTFCSCWDMHSNIKGEKLDCAKFQIVYRKYLHALIDLGYIRAGKFTGAGPGSFNLYGVRGYKHYHLIESRRRSIELELEIEHSPL